MTTIQRRRISRPSLLIVAGLVWTGLTFTTCSSFHGDGIPGVAGFEPERNGVLVPYSLVSIYGVSTRTATIVLSGLNAAGAALVVTGTVFAVRRRRHT